MKDLSTEEKRSIWWNRIKDQILEASYWDISGIPIAIGEGEERDWILEKLHKEGFECDKFGESGVLSMFAFVWLHNI